MNNLPPANRLLALACLAAGGALLLLAAAGYALGFEQAGGLRSYPNIVPLPFFGGLAFLLLGGSLWLTQLPGSLPRLPAAWGILLLALMAWGFAGQYARQMRRQLLLPADIVNWSESAFVDHIIRLRAGAPQFTPMEDANSSVYPPAAPLLTYAVAKVIGKPDSITAFRLIQQVFIFLSALVAAAAARELLRVCRPASRIGSLWMVFWVPFLYVISVNPVTNAFIHTLHNDALALLVNAAAFWLLARHLATGNDRWLWLMALMPALGYWVKQKEAVWLGLYVVYLLLSGASLRKVIAFGTAAAILVALSLGLCLALWGESYSYWTLSTLGALHVSFRKALEQLTDSAWYLLPGLVGALVLLRGERLARLLPAWTPWLLLGLVSTYTSAVAFRPAHLGATSVIAAVWALVALAVAWPEPSATDSTVPPAESERWFQSLAAAAVLLYMFVGYGFYWNDPAAPRAIGEYIRGIEREFAGLPRERVLLDFGSWVYLPESVVMKDRANPLGVIRGTGVGAPTGTQERIRSRYYGRILIRRFGDEGLSWADQIKPDLARHYREVRVIPSPGIINRWPWPYLLREIVVLEPVPEEARAGGTAPPQ